jgi:hypothetical protein
MTHKLKVIDLRKIRVAETDRKNDKKNAPIA